MSGEHEKPRLRLVTPRLDASPPDEAAPAPLRVVAPRSNVIPLRPVPPPPDDSPRGAA